MFKKTLPVLALIIIGFSASVARADNVVITSGVVTTLGSVGTVSLFGPNFSLQYTGEIPAGQMFIPINTVTLSLGLSNITLDGVGSTFFRGLLSFNGSSLSGNITAYGSMEDLFFQQNALFSVNVSAGGLLTITEIPGLGFENRFTVATPEPTTWFLLGTGLSAMTGYIRRRSRRKKPPEEVA